MTLSRHVLATFALIALAACGRDAVAPHVPSATQTLAPSAAAQRSVGGAATARYIVGLRTAVPNLAAYATTLAGAHGGTVQAVYSPAILNGFVVDLDPAAAAQLAANPTVAYVEPDAVVSKSGPGGTQVGAVWGLDRIDQHPRLPTGSYVYPNDGAGVWVYVIDTGILYSHTDFGGRASPGLDAITSGGGAVDCDGHGTHVSGTIGGTKYGVAKAVKLVGVRVLDCFGNGTTTTVLNGMNWVLGQKNANPSRPIIVNMSLGGGISTSLDNAVQSLTNAGVTVVVAAGNSTASACNQSPARAPSAITVAASGSTDVFASFSNFGSCVDIIAPGVGVVSDYIGSNTATASLSGTSMASPHTAGAAALFLSVNPGNSPAQITTALTTNATPNVITSVPAGTPNKLLYVGFIGGGGPVNQPPTATITAPTNGASFTQGASVAFTGSGADPEDGALGGASLVWTSSIDGPIGTGTSFSTSNLSLGTHTITLTAKDSQGATGTATRSITITSGGGNNQPPVADFTFSCVGFNPHQCQFDGSTSTDDAGVVSWAWQWGNGTGETKPFPVTKKTYPAAGTYNVTLTVKDAGGLTATVTKSVVVP